MMRLLMALVLTAMCARADGAPVMVTDHASWNVAVYYKARPGLDADAVFARAVAKAVPPFATVGKRDLAVTAQTPLPFALGGSVPAAEAPLPDPADLPAFSKGMEAADYAQLKGADRCFVVECAGQQADALPGARAVAKVALDLATGLDGVLWDAECRLAYPRRVWDARLVAGWRTDVPHVPDLVNIHLMGDGDLLRAVTLGMTKFGLADLVVSRFPRSATGAVGSLINATMQTMVEGQRLAPDGTYLLDLEAIKDPALRDAVLRDLRSGAKKRVVLTFAEAKPEEGDPEHLLEVVFPTTEALIATLTDLVGADDHAAPAGHTAAVQAASARAKAALPALAARFRRGLPPGDKLLVKLPFATPAGGNEWMWVEVTRWDGDTVQGVLVNAPTAIPNLKTGAPVQRPQSDVFDTQLRHADGKTEGNETAR